jgi:hypothetical protein
MIVAAAAGPGAPVAAAAANAGHAASRLSTRYTPPMHYDAHGPIIADLEARISTIRDSL